MAAAASRIESVANYGLLVSRSPTRGAAVELDTEVVIDDVYVFVDPTEGIDRVEFFLDDPQMSGRPIQIENIVPYDFAGTAPDGSAWPFETLTMADRRHSIAARVTLESGARIVLLSVFGIANDGEPSAAFTSSCRGLSCDFDAADSVGVYTDIVDYTWDFGDGEVGAGVATTHRFVGAGVYPVHLEVRDVLDLVGTTSRSVSVSEAEECSEISTLPCTEVRVEGGLRIDFDGADGGLFDAAGVPIGFTMVDSPTTPGNPTPDPNMPGYWAEKVRVDPAAGTLHLETTAGVQHLSSNDQDNVLGVGLNVPSAQVTLRSRLVDLPEDPPGGFAQAGIWFGSATDFGRGTVEDDYAKLVVLSPEPGAYVIEAAVEQGGVRTSAATVDLPRGTTSVALKVIANPTELTLQASYDLDGDESVLVTFEGIPEEWFSFDQAGLDPLLATRSFGGVLASHRLAGAPLVYAFEGFQITEDPPGGGEIGDLEFDRWQIPVTAATALAWGPDDRLYVAELFGTIRALTLDHDNQSVVDEALIHSITDAHGGDRLTLGLAVDPASKADDVTLWVGHSDGSLNSGEVNSGMVTKLSGPGFVEVDDRIVGLPRALANHALNHIEFGPDGRLYMAMGGNTGAGAPNLANTEFGDRPEQPLSAALLVADVKRPGFSGDCATPLDEFGVPETCDVEVYASGLRNSYDLAWHRNGHLYATDNGLGVTGTVPSSSSPPCTRLADPEVDNPGTQPDLLLRIEPGQYYGHPNPYRDECVFKDGSFQDAPASELYEPPLHVLGNHLSANGIIEYAGEAFYSQLLGQLLFLNYSVGDDLHRVELSPDGRSVLAVERLAGGFTDPLPLTQDPAGNLYVGELNAAAVTVLQPLPLEPPPTGGWKTRSPLPIEIADAAGAAIGRQLFVVGGKTAAGHVSTLYLYDSVTDLWSTGPDRPDEAVENAAVVAYGGKLYAFGGSEQPFSEAVPNAHVFDPATSEWTTLPPMEFARGGAAAAVVDGKIYVAGGLGGDGGSLDSVEVFDPTIDSWSVGPPLQIRRDNPGAAAFDGRLYVFGGRTRNADGTTVNGARRSIEILDPATGAWTFGAPMPTGRRAMVVGTVSGRALVIGGESPVVPANEEYDPATDTWRTLVEMPTPRHGAAAASFDGAVYATGGGTESGSSFSNRVERFSY